MCPDGNTQFQQLPLVPDAVLRRHRVLEKNDTRFRACARLLQALWREAQELPIGQFEPRNRSPRRMGSLLSNTAAQAGRNFLSPAVARLVHREVVYRERGALIDQRRLYTNMLSSMPLAFNLFAPLRLDVELAARVVRSIIPNIDLARVLTVAFEHSPDRGLDGPTGDKSAFDVAIVYQRSDGARGFIGIEQKYSETGSESASPDLSPRYDDLAAVAGLFKDASAAALRRAPLQQLFREHLLAFAALQVGDYAEARFIQVAPRHNHLVQQGAARYASYLTDPAAGVVPFIALDLEQVIKAIGWAGELDYAWALFDRYCAFQKLDAVIDDALRSKADSWTIHPPRALQPISLLAKAA